MAGRPARDALAGSAAQLDVADAEDGVFAFHPVERAGDGVAEAHELGDVAIGGAGEQLAGCADLTDDAVAQDDDAVGEGERLFLVVGDVDGGGAERGVDAADLGPHLEAELGVEVGERLVHQHERRLDDDGARDGDALLLAAGELAGELVFLALEADQGDRLVDAARRLGLRHAAHHQAEADVLAHRHVREQGVVLEHHAEAALLRAERVDAAFVEPDAAAGRGQEPGDAVQRGRLAAAGGAKQGDELALLDRQRDVAERVEGAEVAAQLLEPQLPERGGVDSHFVFLAPICSSQRRKASTILSASSGSSLGALSISFSYSGRPNSFSALWLSSGAMLSGTSLTAGPG